MSQIQLLYQLQQVDSEFQEKRQRLAEVLRAQKETAELLAAQQGLETAVAHHRQWQTQHKNLSLELEGVNSKAQRSEQRLYSGNVKNPKELSDLQSEIAALGRRRAALEDEILEAMITLEEAEEARDAAQTTLDDVTTRWQKAQAGLKKEQHELAVRLNALNEQRKQYVPRIAAERLAEYEQLRQKKGGTAVAGLQQNMCLGCRLTVSATKAKEAQEGRLVYCGGCGRLLCPV
jgi:predicted  nucleic acid-binding Zn-ribbon protein